MALKLARSIAALGAVFLLAFAGSGAASDKRRVLYYAERTDPLTGAFSNAIETIQADGAAKTTLVPFTATGAGISSWANTWPRYSPDGTLVAFKAQDGRLTTVCGGPPDLIYVVPAQGGAPRSVVTNWAQLALCDMRQGADWSPDGRTLVFTGNVGLIQPDGTVAIENHLFAVPAAGGDAIELSRGQAYAEFHVFSPDGTQIAYFAGGSIYLVPSDGSAPPMLVASGNLSTGLSWSRDGSALAYATYDATTTAGEVVVQNLATGAVRSVTGSQLGWGWGAIVTYSPTGQDIAYTMGTGSSTIYVVPAAGGTPQVAAIASPDLAPDFELAWSPDGKEIVYLVSDPACSAFGVERVTLVTGRIQTVLPQEAGTYLRYPSFHP
jgi:Tol biopolymer transport system component